MAYTKRQNSEAKSSAKK